MGLFQQPVSVECPATRGASIDYANSQNAACQLPAAACQLLSPSVLALRRPPRSLPAACCQLPAVFPCPNHPFSPLGARRSALCSSCRTVVRSSPIRVSPRNVCCQLFSASALVPSNVFHPSRWTLSSLDCRTAVPSFASALDLPSPPISCAFSWISQIERE